tara:strand:- start:117 stop:584 length:468 start_codon:yes stop_codon:yes gene_type:complete
MIEIERKFLVRSKRYKKNSLSKHYVKQGYLNTDPSRCVRVRIIDEKAFITIKGISSTDGLSRFEWEKEICKKEADDIIKLCSADTIEKIRHVFEFEGNKFEIDEFQNKNNGLVIAEIELKSKNQLFKKPEWIGKEVTGIKKYYNSQLAQKPFSKW